MPATSAYAPPSVTRGPNDLVARARTHLLVPVALAGGVALWDPARRGGPGLCPYRFVTGHNCPGCGLTRSVGALGGKTGLPKIIASGCRRDCSM